MDVISHKTTCQELISFFKILWRFYKTDKLQKIDTKDNFDKLINTMEFDYIE